mmetsp:Transcript_23836/g.75032  ORF Transcript_23836/g.75032 Transcript_23836/m.75032 type:complete len:206 (-) Transcript_23836:662-1279(-)
MTGVARCSASTAAWITCTHRLRRRPTTSASPRQPGGTSPGKRLRGATPYHWGRATTPSRTTASRGHLRCTCRSPPSTPRPAWCCSTTASWRAPTLCSTITRPRTWPTSTTSSRSRCRARSRRTARRCPRGTWAAAAQATKTPASRPTTWALRRRCWTTCATPTSPSTPPRPSPWASPTALGWSTGSPARCQGSSRASPRRRTAPI